MTEATTQETPAKPMTPYDRIGGAPVISAIVNDFYDRMEQDPAFKELRDMHAPDLSPMRESLAGYLAAWSGGPRDWFEQRPGACIMSAHRKLATPITKLTADQWVTAMHQAIDTHLGHDVPLATSMKDALRQMSIGMISA
jgi:hemoglobin